MTAASDDFDGWAVAHRINVGKVNPRRLCNTVWHYLTEGGSTEQRAKLKAQLMRPLPGQQKVSTEVVEFERDMFTKALKRGI